MKKRMLGKIYSEQFILTISLKDFSKKDLKQILLQVFSLFF